MTIQYTWRAVKLAARSARSEKNTMVVIGDYATQHLSMALQGVLTLDGVPVSVHDTDYDQISAQVLDPDSELYRAKPDAVLFTLCTEKLYDHWCDTPAEGRTHFAKQQVNSLSTLMVHLASRIRCRIFLATFPTVDDAVFGSYACKVEASFPWQLKQLNALLWQWAAEDPSLHLIDMDEIQLALGRAAFSEQKMYYIARMPYSQAAMILTAQVLSSAMAAAFGRIHKCVVLDLDNTLWGGVIGDDGLSGIQIGELGTGRAFLSFQKWLKELKARGILLAVCSKNNEATAKEPFEKHPDMALRLDDFAIFVANWEDKASNIRRICEQLDLGIDSLVFVDDNSFERNAVRSLIPDICVPELPEDPAEYVPYLRSLNLFETASYSTDDAGRTKQYQARQRRIGAWSQSWLITARIMTGCFSGIIPIVFLTWVSQNRIW